MTKPASPVENQDASIIALDRFIQATRDSGYKGTSSAVSELVDNSIQARAARIAISIAVDGGYDDRAIVVSVLDDGTGMDPFTLRQALRFGGTTRFGDRSGLGRYGMGLPNASLSQAQRVVVYTWQSAEQTRSRASRDASPSRVYMSYLDVDEIAHCELKEVPLPRLVKNPPHPCRGPSGTLVSWTRCDRLDNRRISTIVRKLEAELGRRFRHFIWNGLRITINGEVIAPIDPLYLHPKALSSGAQRFGEELRYEVRAESGSRTTGWVSVTFSELPVNEWQRFSNEDKRRLGISKGAGISIVRAGREVDYGWFFMGTKHRENYDDWWRCEVQFDPVLDEAFGITHTKQQARPQAYLIEALTPDLEATARALNARARKAHTAVKAAERFSQAESVANRRDHLLAPLPSKAGAKARALMTELENAHPELRREEGRQSRYSVVEGSVQDKSFFTFAHDGKRLVLVLNPAHPFYREIYRPLADSDNPRDHQLRAKIELLLLSAARSEASSSERVVSLARHRLDWSNTLATFLND